MSYNFHERGVPAVNEATCTGCGQCVAICPDEVLAMDDGKPRPGNGIFLGCFACGHCMAVCPTRSISVTGRDLKPDDRIELPPPAARATADQLEALLVARRSVRRFTAEEVPRALLERIVRAVETAPMGIPPSDVGVVVFAGRRQVQAFAEEACASFARMARFLSPLMMAVMRPFVGKVQYEVFRDFIRPLLRMLPEMRSRGRDLFTYDAPAAMLFHGDPGDSMIAATYAMLAAEALGLGSCMLGTTVALARDQRLRAKYGIPAESKVGVGLVLGYPAVEFRRGIRRRLAAAKWVE
jgi:nitroreductase/NAD-dependent dihydropyrimidine dehydrogenase PreA subunit